MADDKTPVENNDTAQAAEDAREAKLAAAIANGMKASFSEAIKPLVDEINAGRVQPPNHLPTSSEPAIEEVSEEAILEAIEAGDRAKAAGLMRQQRRADAQKRERELAQIRGQGGAAFGSVAKMAAEKLPYYTGKFKKLIDAKIDDFRAANPGALILPEHYKTAHDMIVGENWEEIRAADRESEIRQSREREAAQSLEPGEAGRVVGGAVKPEPVSLQEVLAGDWKAEFREKQRQVGGRSEEEELRRIGFRGGFKEFIETRKKMEAEDEATNGSFGLDKDWDKSKGEWV